jgi:two-component sensor histidine kinase
MTDEAPEERRRAAARQDLLIAELNHRVRNILAAGLQLSLVIWSWARARL